MIAAKTNLQIPISVSLRDSAASVALSQGFSSLQEMLRVFLSSYSAGDIQVGFDTISAKRAKEYEEDVKKTIAGIKSGEIKQYGTTKSALEHLNSL